MGSKIKMFSCNIYDSIKLKQFIDIKILLILLGFLPFLFSMSADMRLLFDILVIPKRMMPKMINTEINYSS